MPEFSKAQLDEYRRFALTWTVPLLYPAIKSWEDEEVKLHVLECTGYINGGYTPWCPMHLQLANAGILCLAQTHAADVKGRDP